MTSTDRNYFRYFSPALVRDSWGLGVTAAGFTVISPGQHYPPVRHPADHAFTWEKGRRLPAMQIVLISEGRGWFESKETGRRRIDAGSAFALLPGVWHRYRPSHATGWTESWMEVRGPVVDRLIGESVLTARSAVRRHAEASGLGELLEAVHTRARMAGTAFDPELSARALGVLAAWARTGKARSDPSSALLAIVKAERYLTAHLTDPVNIAALAGRLGIAYSHFRRLFRRHTGYAPWAYVLRLRLMQARRLLENGDGKLEDIATQLGFSSPYHLSSAFKRAFGESPDYWRKRRNMTAKNRVRKAPSAQA